MFRRRAYTRNSTFSRFLMHCVCVFVCSFHDSGHSYNFVEKVVRTKRSTAVFIVWKLYMQCIITRTRRYENQINPFKRASLNFNAFCVSPDDFIFVSRRWNDTLYAFGIFFSDADAFFTLETSAEVSIFKFLSAISTFFDYPLHEVDVLCPRVKNKCEYPSMLSNIFAESLPRRAPVPIVSSGICAC